MHIASENPVRDDIMNEVCGMGYEFWGMWCGVCGKIL